MQNELLSMCTRKTELGGRVLVVDDDAEILRTHERILKAAGYSVETASNVNDALACVDEKPFDAVVSDVTMAGRDGIDFLRAIRERNMDLPVTLVTGDPAVGTAVLAVQYGAFQYLIKPVAAEALVGVVTRAVRLNAFNRDRRAAAVRLGQDTNSDDKFVLGLDVERALESLYMAYQPVVAPGRRIVVAHEALLRTRHERLGGPLELLAAAERAGRIREVGRAVRARVAQDIEARAPSSEYFVNLHADELADEELYSPDAPLTRHAKRIVLEITERAAIDTVRDVRLRVLRLREMGFRIAVDDLGAGYAGLTSFAVLEPDIVKIDMSLVRGLEQNPVKKRLVKSIVELGKDLGILVVAEGVEQAAERDALLALDCELHQGFLYARAAAEFPEVVW